MVPWLLVSGEPLCTLVPWLLVSGEPLYTLVLWLLVSGESLYTLVPWLLVSGESSYTLVLWFVGLWRTLVYIGSLAGVRWRNTGSGAIGGMTPLDIRWSMVLWIRC